MGSAGGKGEGRRWWELRVDCCFGDFMRTPPPPQTPQIPDWELVNLPSLPFLKDKKKNTNQSTLQATGVETRGLKACDYTRVSYQVLSFWF